MIYDIGKGFVQVATQRFTKKFTLVPEETSVAHVHKAPSLQSGYSYLPLSSEPRMESLDNTRGTTLIQKSNRLPFRLSSDEMTKQLVESRASSFVFHGKIMCLLHGIYLPIRNAYIVA